MSLMKFLAAMAFSSYESASLGLRGGEVVYIKPMLMFDVCPFRGGQIVPRARLAFDISGTVSIFLETSTGSRIASVSFSVEWEASQFSDEPLSVTCELTALPDVSRLHASVARPVGVEQQP